MVVQFVSAGDAGSRESLIRALMRRLIREVLEEMEEKRCLREAV